MEKISSVHLLLLCEIMTITDEKRIDTQGHAQKEQTWVSGQSDKGGGNLGFYFLKITINIQFSFLVIQVFRVLSFFSSK